MQMPNYLEKLLDGVEVEWKELETVVKTVTAPSKAKREAYREVGRLPIVDQGIEFIAGYTDEDFTPVKNGEYVIFGDHSEHIKYVDFSFVQGADGLKILKPIENNPKYIYYAFLNFYRKSLSYKRHWSKAKSTLIPIPCPNNPEKSLQIQREIVRILDTFTELTAELTAELNLRKQQYQYYRDKLLTFSDDEVEWKPLNEVFNIKNGYTPSKSNKEYWENGTVPWFRMDDIRENGRILEDSLQKVSMSAIKGGKLFPENSIIISTSATIGEHALIKVPHLSNQRFTNLSLKDSYKEKLDIKFVFYYMYVLDEWCKNNTTKSSFSTVDMASFKKFPIPLPPLEEQKRIVAILDKFDTLTHSISEGLPREIELRQKQYEYYRDLLLSFPPPSQQSGK